jgi:HAD superfamily hydrolase (TIGR01450 family)
MTTLDVTSSRPDRVYAGYIFDMDGTIYLGEHLLPGVAETIGFLRERGATIRYLSNNPTRDPSQYKAKLEHLGLPTPLDDIVNTVVSTVNWLRDFAPDAVLFPIAEEPLVRALTEAGFRLSEDPSEIDIVIASYDRGFNYRKLQIAFDTLWHHKRGILVQTNPDRYCPFPGGRGEPDCAAIVAAIEACTGVKCSANFGKPDPIMAKEALHGLDIDPADVLMVGDRLATDVSMGRLAGMSTALVLTGDNTLADVAALPPGEHPTYIVETVQQLIPAAVWAERRTGSH